MRKKIFFVLLIFISTKIYSIEDKHERIGIEKEKLLEIELDLSCVAEFYSYSGYNTYTTIPQIGCNFTLLNDYVFSIYEPVTIQLNDINSTYPESAQNGLKFAFDDFSFRFMWKKPYKSWRFQVGTSMTFPTSPWKQKNAKHFVTGSGRFTQSLLFNASYISDPVIIGGNFSYTFVTPQIKNKATGWIPGILNTGINFTSVMNNYFSISCSGSVCWNSGQHIDKKYIQGQANISESLQVQISWQKQKWSIASFVGLSFRQQQVNPSWGLTYTRSLFEK